ncbi:MAG TPA: ATP-binding protein, partial [Sphingobacteriaceae bacterium]
VKQSHEAVYLLNPEGRIISWNQGAEKIYGYSEEEALHMNIWNIVPEYLVGQSHQVVNSILNGKKIRSLETKRITRNGRIIDVSFSAAVITDASRTLRSVAITESDITLQKQAEQEIRQLNADLQANVQQLEVTNKELESFSYSVSHDLRAPLRAINGYAGIIREEYRETLDEEHGRLLSIIENNARKMGVLIDELLAFSKIGRKEVVKTSIQTPEMVRQIIRELEGTYPKTQWKVRKLAPIQGDYILINQCFVNLISNAAKYSSGKPDPCVEIGSEKNQNEHIFYVRDNGAGFNMEYAGKLFGVFQRLHSDAEFEGTGVGLAIAQRIVVKHGGRIWAEAEIGKGATFYIALPIERSNESK